MLYVNKTTGKLVHLLDFTGKDEALILCLQGNSTKTISRKDFKKDYVLVNIEATRKHICGCYDNKVK
jgi:hypothetical protein